MAPVPEPSIQSGVPLAARSSLRVGGPARWFTVASSSEDVAGAHAWSQAHGVPMVVLGGGTNVVIADAGLDALVVAVQPRGLAVVEDRETLSVAAAAGEPWDAVVEATEHRRRPILLTAAAASMGMIPIAREVFWGPMAYAMIGGIVIATLLTLLFLPALYVAWYKIREPKKEAQ